MNPLLPFPPPHHIAHPQSQLPASFNILKLAAPMMAEAGGGSIVCVGAAVVHHGARSASR